MEGSDDDVEDLVNVAPMSVMWLAPQFFLVGAGEVFFVVAMIEVMYS